MADLDAAIHAGQAAVAATPAIGSAAAGYRSNLSAALRIRFEQTGAHADLDAAIRSAQAAVAATPADNPVAATYLTNLGIALRVRFQRSGAMTDLDAAVHAGQAAVDAALADDPDRVIYLSNLGVALRIRFERGGAMADLDAAIRAAQASVAATPADHPYRARYLSNLGAALQSRFDRTGMQTDLDAAITAGEAAVEATPAGHPNLTGRLSNLGGSLQARFEATGVLADLDAAIRAGQAAIEVAPPDHPSRATSLFNLTLALRNRYLQGGALPDLDAAIRAGQAAVDTIPADHPNRAAMLSELGATLNIRFEQTGVQADLDAAVRAGQTAAAVEVASPRARARGALVWGRAAGAARRWREAAAGFETAVGLLGGVAPRGLDRPDQEHLLFEMSGLAADAAACCVRAGLPERAVELFEQGRGVLLGQALDTRTDVTALAELHPDLARRFVELCYELDRPSEPAEPAAEQPGAALLDSARMARVQARRQRAVADFDQHVAEIRALPAFRDFLLPPPVEQLRAAAADGPVVIVAVSAFGSHALLVTSGSIDVVELGELTPAEVNNRVADFLDALATPRSSATRIAAQRRLDDILGWLWDAVAGPVLDHLGIHGPPEEEQSWPRVWWCVAGLLSFLPVHAAGHHSSRTAPAPATVIDRVISSYTPTVRGLAYARRVGHVDTERPRPTDGLDRQSVMAVAMPHTPGAADLPGAHAEAASLEERFPGGVTVLTDTEATRQAVLAGLPDTRWVHFACHGTAEITDPSNSRLLLHDQPLTVVDVAQLRLHHAELAFLSACETARPGARLADEAIHLASAFQLAGYRHVIATLWPVADHSAVTFAEYIYATLSEPPNIAGAVHTATRNLRDSWPRHPSEWASHIHAGA